MEVYLGIDVGSVTTKFVLLNGDDKVVYSRYMLTSGRPALVLKQGLKEIVKFGSAATGVMGVGVTGSARHLAANLVGADIVKNEITCQAVAAVDFLPEVQTVIEIGGQDSKLIIVRDGMVTDFGMNTVCAAGTGSFLDHQAARLNISIEEFSEQALRGDVSVTITGRCTVFAESDMVHKQQTGDRTENIIYGLCQALVRNYLSDVASGKEIRSPVVFQGGVAFNRGIIRALGDELNTEIIVPPRHEVMGAIGAAILVHEVMEGNGADSRFRGFDIDEEDCVTASYKRPENHRSCEMIGLSQD